MIALWNPEIPWLRPPRDLILVIDESLSMGKGPGQSFWAELGKSVAELPTGSRVGAVRFGSEPAVQSVPLDPTADHMGAILSSAPSSLDRSASNIESALKTALGTADSTRPTVMILVTDGRETHGEAANALRIAETAGVPVYLAKPSEGKRADDGWIESLDLPAQIRAGTRIPLVATLGSRTKQNAVLQVAVNGSSILESAVSLEPERAITVPLSFSLPRPGTYEVEVSLAAERDALLSNNRRRKLLVALGEASVLYVAADGNPSPVLQGLIKGGWPVQAIDISRFAAFSKSLNGFGTIILDDVAIGDLADDDWRALIEATEREGVGLIVLGGPRSFSAGAYRGSRLEQALPVIAEPAEPDDRAAVLFLVDKSGSMDREHLSVSRFAYARKAVIETARTLGPRDLSGLIWFDAEVRQAVDLGARSDPAAALRRSWTAQPSGGTVLSPALRTAIDRLGRSGAEQRLLVLVTDGFVSEDENGSDMAKEIAASRIDLISLIIGGNQDVEPLEQLSRLNAGQLLHVDQIAQLPRLMRQEVEKARNPAQLDRVVPRSTRNLPYLPGIDRWPDLRGYMVTRSKPTATVYLESDRGDPLLAMSHAGAARVVALPGGLGSWASDWHSWKDWDIFLGGLVEWVSARSSDPHLDLQLKDRPYGLDIAVDAVTGAFDWLSTTGATVTISDQRATGSREMPLEQVAPGRYQAQVPLPHAGRFTVIVRIGQLSVRREVLHTADHEFALDRSAADPWPRLIEAGLVVPWQPGDPLGKAGPQPSGIRVRQIWAVLALLLLVFHLVHERRRPLGEMLRRACSRAAQHARSRGLSLRLPRRFLQNRVKRGS